MEIKYEPVFGPQKLFDCASDDAVLAIRDTTSGRIHIFTNDGWIKSGLKHERHIGTSDNQIAMRRIIKTPVWTVADQQAGRLPEVGCLVATIPNFDCTVVGVDEERKNIAIQYESGKLDVVRVHCVSPIESPEEKAARLREEWVSKATFMRTYEIYDNLLTGDLPVPVAPEQNK